MCDDRFSDTCLEKPEIPRDIIDKGTFKEYVFYNYCLKRIELWRNKCGY